MQWMSYSVPAEALQIHPHRDHNYEIRPSDRHDLMGPAPPLAAYLQKLSIIEMRFDSMAEIVAQTCNGHHQDVLV